MACFPDKISNFWHFVNCWQRLLSPESRFIGMRHLLKTASRSDTASLHFSLLVLRFLLPRRLRIQTVGWCWTLNVRCWTFFCLCPSRPFCPLSLSCPCHLERSRDASKTQNVTQIFLFFLQIHKKTYIKKRTCMSILSIVSTPAVSLISNFLRSRRSVIKSAV